MFMYSCLLWLIRLYTCVIYLTKSSKALTEEVQVGTGLDHPYKDVELCLIIPTLPSKKPNHFFVLLSLAFKVAHMSLQCWCNAVVCVLVPCVWRQIGVGG